MAVQFRERPEFLRGRAAELRVSRWLQEHGWFVIPSYDYAGDERDKAPRLQGLLGGYAVPDLDVARNGNRRWVEVKSKAKPNVRYSDRPWGTPNVEEHGVDHRNFLDYQKVERITGDEVWIAIYEENSGDLLAQTLTVLGVPRVGSWLGKNIANWPRGRFRWLHTFDPEDES